MRLLAGIQHDRALSWDEHRALHGDPPSGDALLLDTIASAGLRGRGGASFPTGAKLKAVAARRGPRVVLVNGAEGEPLSAKDRVLMRKSPHLVLDGALAAADAIGAEKVVMAVAGDAPRAVEALAVAATERGARGRIEVVPVPAAYLAGEETALIRHLDGGPLRPTTTPPLPFERGLRHRPTLVQNPETLAHLALILRHGPGWFREAGTLEHPGTALITLGGAVARPGVQEIGLGTPLRAVIDTAGGLTHEPIGILVGGYHGCWIPAVALPQVTLDDEGLAWYGASLAAGVIVVLGAGACPVQEVTRIMGWLERESAHQCGPCSNGLPAIAAALQAIASGRDDGHGLERVQRWLGLIVRRGACRLPDGAARFLRSALDVFAPEFERHARRGPCHACAHATTLAA